MSDRKILEKLLLDTDKDIMVEDEYGMELVIDTIELDENGYIVIKTR